MTSIKYLLPTLAIVFTSQTTLASITNPKTSNVLEKVSIYGHTGQDPAPRSFVGNSGSIFHYDDKLFVGISLTLDLHALLLEKAIAELDWTIDFDTPGTTTSIKFDPLAGDMLSPTRVGVRSSTPISGGGIPAPPTILLLLSGLAITMRRRQ